MNIITSFNFTKLDAVAATNARSLKKADSEFIIKGVAIAEQPDTETGEVRTVAFIKTDADMFMTVSATVMQTLSALCDFADDDPEMAENGFIGKIKKETSGAGREYLRLIIQTTK